MLVAVGLYRMLVPAGEECWSGALRCPLMIEYDRCAAGF